MRKLVFAIHDVKVEAYEPMLMLLNTKGEALRSFGDLVNDAQTRIAKHPEDFTLFEVGQFDCDKGILVPHEVTIPLAKALEFVKN